MSKFDIKKAEDLKSNYHESYRDIFNTLYSSFPSFFITMILFFLTIYQTLNSVDSQNFLILIITITLTFIFLLFFQAFFFNLSSQLRDYGSEILNTCKSIKKEEGPNSFYKDEDIKRLEDFFEKNNVSVNILYNIFITLTFFILIGIILVLSENIKCSIIFVLLSLVIFLINAPAKLFVILVKNYNFIFEKNIFSKNNQ